MVRSATSNTSIPAGGIRSGALDIGQLNAFAIEALGPMYFPKERVFCYRLKREQSGLVREGLSRRYTMMVCLGLQRCEAAGLTSPFDIRSILDGLLLSTDWIDDIGDLGLLLWLASVSAPQELGRLCSRAEVQHALSRFPQAREGRTMQLAWFLTGLAYASSEVPGLASHLEALAAETYRRLIRNGGSQGAFGHLGKRPTSILRSHIGSFADQVYPIYALTKYSQVFKSKEALGIAERCADLICRHQGSLGQWWWHYSSATGKVVERYPVYSVHQDGMAPMALFALSQATGRDFSAPIYKGLRWIAGDNELGVDLRDPAAGVIWRSAYLKSAYQHRVSQALGALGFEGSEKPGNDLQIRFECRPYHLGWLLYAFAGREISGVRL